MGSSSCRAIDSGSTPVCEDGPYGAMMMHEMGHDFFWEKLRKRGAVPLDMEHGEVPRGRVSYNTAPGPSFPRNQDVIRAEVVFGRFVGFTTFLGRCCRLAKSQWTRKVLCNAAVRDGPSKANRHKQRRTGPSR
jgi:hypothetical protein